MPIGTPVFLGNNDAANTVTTVADCPSGSLIIVTVSDWDNIDSDFSGFTITDNATGGSNTYSFATQSPRSASHAVVGLFYCLNSAHDLPNGGTIHTSDSGAFDQVKAAYVTGANGGVDVKVSGGGFTSATTTSLASGSLAQASEIVLGSFTITSNSGGTTEANGFTSIDHTGACDLAYLIVSATSSVTYNPSWTSTGNGGAVVVSFKATASASGGLRFNSNLDGLGASGGFFRDPLGAKPKSVGWQPSLIVNPRKLIRPSPRDIKRLAA